MIKMIYLKRINEKDKVNFRTYQQMLERKDTAQAFNSTAEELDAYFKKIEWLLRSGVTNKIAQSKAKLEIVMNEQKRLEEDLAHQTASVAHRRDLTELKIERGERRGSSAGLEKSSPMTVMLNTVKQQGTSLFRVVQSNPQSFKSASISVSRKKMRKLANVEVYEPINIDSLSAAQRRSFEKVIGDKYTSDEIKGVYDICLNYQKKINQPGRSEVNFRRTKEMLFRSINEFERKMEIPTNDKPKHMIRRHKSSSSIRPG